MNTTSPVTGAARPTRGPNLALVLGWFILLFGACVAGAWAAAVTPSATWSAAVLMASIAGGVFMLAVAPITLLFARRESLKRNEIDRLLHLAEEIREHSELSDASKRMLYRDRELDLLRMLTEQDIATGDFNSAMRMVNELALQFGFLEEAEAFRSRIEEARRADVERQIKIGLEQLNRNLTSEDWHGAMLLATRLKRLYPDEPSVQDLENHVALVRRRHAAGLAHSLDDARSEDRIDDAMQLLKELDRHVDTEEAQRLRPVAKAVVVRHREELADRFREAVESRDWPKALTLGEEIITEHPNTKMAEEVSGLLGELQSRVQNTSHTPE